MDCDFECMRFGGYSVILHTCWVCIMWTNAQYVLR